MKRVFIILGLISVVAGIILIIVYNQPKVGNRYITVTSTYNYVYTETKKIDVMIYANNMDSVLSNVDSYESSYLVNKDETKKLEIELSEIIRSNAEYYLDETYYGFNLFYEMPRLNGDYNMRECFLKLTLKNNDTHLFYIGSMDLMYHDNVGMEDVFSVSALYGSKSETNYLSRLRNITIEAAGPIYQDIDNISLGKFVDATFKCDGNKINISIKESESRLTNAPIVITFSNNMTQVIDNFVYFRDFEVLSENGILVNVYS